MDLLKPSYATGYAKNASQSAHPNLWDGLVGAWMPSFGVTGETLRDVSGNGNHGTLTNMDASSDWVATSKGLALDFDGSNDVVLSRNLLNGLAVDRGLTFTACIKPDSLASQGFISGVWGQSRTLDQAGFFVINSGVLVAVNGGTGDEIGFGVSNTLTTGEWQFIAGTWTYDGVYKVYQDGRFLGSGYQSTSGFLSSSPIANFHIGSQNTTGFRAFDGSISNTSIYNRALSTTEIKQLYVDSLAPFRTKKRTVVRVPAAIPTATKVGSIKKPTTIIKPSYQAGYARNASESENPKLWDGLVGAWMPSLGVTGETLRDVSGNGNHGTLRNMDAASDWVATSKGLALDFDGNDDYVALGSISAKNPLTLNGDLGGTIVCVAKTIAGDPFQRLFDKSNGPTGTNGYAIALDSTYGINPQINGRWAYTGVTYSYNRFYHFAFTFSGADWRIYQDAERKSLSIGGGPLWSNIPQVATLARIGTWNHSDARELKGSIASLSIYNRALSPTEIKQLYVDSLAPFRRKQRVSVAVPADTPTPTATYHPLRSLAHPLEQ